MALQTLRAVIALHVSTLAGLLEAETLQPARRPRPDRKRQRRGLSFYRFNR